MCFCLTKAVAYTTWCIISITVSLFHFVFVALPGMASILLTTLILELVIAQEGFIGIGQISRQLNLIDCELAWS